MNESFVKKATRGWLVLGLAIGICFSSFAGAVPAADEVELVVSDSGAVFVRSSPEARPILITGELLYPTPWVLGHLGLDKLLTLEQKAAVHVDLSARARLNRKNEKLDPVWMPSDVRGLRILSVAEGTGGLMPFLNEKAGAKAIGLDLSYFRDLPKRDVLLADDKALAGIQTRYEERHRANLKQGNALALPYPDDEFDMVVSSFLLNNLPEVNIEAKAVEEGFRVVRPGGTVRFTFANRQDPLGHATKLIAGIPRDRFEFFVIHGPVGISSRLERGAPYPSDSFEWKEFQEMLPISMRGIPLPMPGLKRHLNEWPHGVVILKKIR